MSIGDPTAPGKPETAQQIERWLCRHPKVRAAAVLVDRPGPRSVGVFVVLEEPLADAELQTHAVRALADPDSLGTVLSLDAIPTDKAGHVDEPALRELLRRHHEEDDRFVEPATDLERRLAGMWADLLAADRISAEEDFFDAGGHSLLMGLLQLRIRGEFRVDVPFGDLLRHGRLRDMAKLVAEHSKPSA